MDAPLPLWIGFNAVVLTLLLLDLFLLNRRPRQVTLQEAGAWTLGVVSFGLATGVLVAWSRGLPRGVEFLTGYLVEYSLSVDNIFVFVMLFRYFAVPPAYQHRVLFWGILAAIVLRGAMILAGATLIERHAWMLYVFGAFLLATGLRMLVQGDEPNDPGQNPMVKWGRRVLPLAPAYDGARFLTRVEGRWRATPLLLVLITVETSDVVFAVDSIPAIFGITQDTFVVYSSNICAVLGLRALYFLLAGVMDRFRHLQTGLALVLAFIGGKMLLTHFFHIGTFVSLGVVLTILGCSVALSIWQHRQESRVSSRDASSR